MIGRNTSKTDQDDVCKLGSVCCALSPVPWSQLRLETKEHFIGWCCQPSKYSSFQFSFFSEFPVTKKKKNIFSQIITRVNIYNHLLIKWQKRCYATALVQNFVCNFSGGHFPTCRDFLHLELELFSSSITGNFHIYLFQPNLPSSFACSSILVMTDWQAEKGKSKFIIRKEWNFYFFLILGTKNLIIMLW